MRLQESPIDRDALYAEIKNLHDDLVALGVKSQKLTELYPALRNFDAQSNDEILRTRDQMREIYDTLAREKRNRQLYTPAIAALTLLIIIGVWKVLGSHVTGTTEDQIQADQPGQADTSTEILGPPDGTPEFLGLDEIQNIELWHDENFANLLDEGHSIFNVATGNSQFAVVGVAGPIANRWGNHKPPYEAILFKPVSREALLQISPKLGLGPPPRYGTLTDLINATTKYTAKDVKKIRAIVTAAYEYAFKIKIDQEHIEVVAAPDGSVQSIRYTGPNPEQLTVTTFSASVVEDDEFVLGELRPVHGGETREQNLVGPGNELLWPPDGYTDDAGAIPIPLRAIKDIDRVAYECTFESQGRQIAIKIDIPVTAGFGGKDNQGLPLINNTWNLDAEVMADDPFIQKLAHLLTDQFPTKEGKLRAILDFLHTFNFSNGSSFRDHHPILTLMKRGGEEFDGAVLAASLARAVGIETAFVYSENERDAAPVFDIDRVYAAGTGVVFPSYIPPEGHGRQRFFVFGGPIDHVDVAYLPTGTRVTRSPALIGERPFGFRDDPKFIQFTGQDELLPL